MAQPSAPPSKDQIALLSHQEQPGNSEPYAHCYPEPPPPYTHYAASSGVAPAPQLVAPAPQPIAPAPQPVAPYIQQAPVLVPAPVAYAPVQQSVAAPPQQQIIVVGGNSTLPPGTCTVCRKGRMKNSASFWSWLCCCLFLPVGIIPGLIIFCCCCREPKCTSCGYTP